MIKTFEFTYDELSAEAIFRVDTEKFTAEIAELILESYIWDYDPFDDPIDQAMRKIAMIAIELCTRYNDNLWGVKKRFNQEDFFLPVDGSAGIELTKIRKYEFTEEKLEVIIS